LENNSSRQERTLKKKNDNVLFLEAMLEVTSVRCQRQTIAAWLPAFVYLKRAGKQRFRLAACT
jgi:hypothetical protein